MRRIHIDLLFFSFLFSAFFCICCLFVDKLLTFWVFLELCGMSIIPSFFYKTSSILQGFYSSLLSYIVMSGLSSFLMATGIIIKSLYVFVLFGFLVKLGLFPFSLWVYRVFSKSKWVFIFMLSVVLKFPILFFCFLFQNNYYVLVYFDSMLTILMCRALFWFFSLRWEFIWCHISLCSVSTLLVACFCSDFTSCLFIYIYYFFWSCFLLTYFYFLVEFFGTKWGFWVYCFLLLVTPISFPLFYKLLVCLSILYSSIFVLLSWCVYRFSEQFFLFKLGGDLLYSSIFNKWGS